MLRLRDSLANEDARTNILPADQCQHAYAAGT